MLIAQLDLDLDKGLTVLTGETGAGKSMLLDAILYCLGDKVNTNILSKDATFCSVTLTFENDDNITSLLQEHDIELEDYLIVSRSENAQGKKRQLINGQIVPNKIVQIFAQYLITICGQHNHTELFSSNKQLDILDKYANNEHLRKKIREHYYKWNQAQENLDEFRRDADKIHREIDYLEATCKELELLGIKEDEENILFQERLDYQKQLKSYKDLIEVKKLIDGDIITNRIISAQKLLIKMQDLPEQESLLKNLEQAIENIDNVTITVDNYKLDNDIEKRLTATEERLFLIKEIARKHRCHSYELNALSSKYQKELSELKTKEINSIELSKIVENNKEEYLKIAKKISDNRLQAALELVGNVNKELAELEMKGAKFDIKIQPQSLENKSSSGLDIVTFVGQMNPGSTQIAIAKVASGGEMSRFMLAIMASFLFAEKPQLIIFDEIDSGTSGVAAESIAKKLSNLSKQIPLIVVTHQAQIAAKATKHILVTKELVNASSATNFSFIKDDERIEELSRIIAGKNITHQVRAAAIELLKSGN
ncbi:MAG: AAA family ATPase [Rickettsiaceae bacterium]|nr:AAA family ATPase [Rickettsiaceae bacterium]